MGSVYEARQLDCDRLVALKLSHIELNSDKEMEGRFVQEARALSLLHHAHIVTVYQLSISNSGIPYLVMELVSGHSLRDLIITEGALPPKRALAIITQACEALAYAHENGVVHRDVKPENIVLLPTPHPDFVKILDFGLAKFIYSGEQLQKLTQTGLLIGTANYMSPEQCLGQAADHRSDIYSLTAVLYELLSGSAPYSADNAMGVLYKHLNDPLPKLEADTIKEFHPSLQKVIDCGMAKDADERFQSMAELQIALAEAAELLGTKSAAAESGQIWSGRRFALFGGVFLGFLLLFSCMLCIRNFKSSEPTKLVKTTASTASAPKSRSVLVRLRQIRETLDDGEKFANLSSTDLHSMQTDLERIIASTSKNKQLQCAARLLKARLQRSILSPAYSMDVEDNLKKCLSICKSDDGRPTIEAAEADYWLAAFYLQAKRLDEAEAAIKKAYDLRSAYEMEVSNVPSLDIPTFLLGSHGFRASSGDCSLYGKIMEAKHKNDEALKWYDLSLKRSSSDTNWKWQFYLDKAAFLFRIGRKDEARNLIKEYEKLLYKFAIVTGTDDGRELASSAGKTLGLNVGSVQVDNSIEVFSRVAEYAVSMNELELAKSAYESQIDICQKLGLKRPILDSAKKHIEELDARKKR